MTLSRRFWRNKLLLSSPAGKAKDITSALSPATKRFPRSTRLLKRPTKATPLSSRFKPVKIDDDNPDYPALLLANYMMGGGFLNSRLATRIRVKDGLSYGIASRLDAPTKEDSGSFLTYAISAPQNAPKVEADFLEELKLAIAGGFTPSEVSAAKSGWLQSRQVSRGQDNELATLLANHAFWGRTLHWDSTLEGKVSGLQPADVNAALRKYIDPAKVSIFKAGDFSKAGVKPAAPPTVAPQNSRTN